MYLKKTTCRIGPWCIEAIGYAATAAIAVKMAYMSYRVVYVYFVAGKVKNLAEYSGGKWAGRDCPTRAWVGGQQMQL